MKVIDGSGKWFYDKFEGFSIKNCSWDMSGNYEAVASILSYKTPYIFSNYFNKTEEYELPFGIYVEGKYACCIKKNIALITFSIEY